MRREAPRTIQSVAPSYQRVEADRYAVHLVEMPSAGMLGPEATAAFPANVRHVVESENHPLSVAANRAVRRAGTDHVLLCIDGARIWSDGIVRHCLDAVRSRPRGVLAFHGLHLGHGVQRDTVAAGTYSREIEDALLRGIDFPRQPSALWRIGSWAGSSANGWFAPMAESHAVLFPRDLFEAIGGFDERETLPGGGVANSDFYTRLVEAPGRPLTHVLGEGTFHQHHGGGSTKLHGNAYRKLVQGFEARTGRPFRLNDRRSFGFYGTLPPAALGHARRSLASIRRSDERNVPRKGVDAVRRAQGRAGAATASASLPPTVIVLGMHRSATSFVARQLARAGWRVPGTAMGADPLSNPEGHFEPLEIVAWHNAALGDVDATWRAVHAPDWRGRGEDYLEWRARSLRRLLLGLCERDGGDGARWVVKDPRQCLALPLWDRALAGIEPRPTVLHVMRHPGAVARSLHRRDGIAPEIGRLMWARNVHDQLAWVRDGRDVATTDAMTTEELTALLERVVGPLDAPIQPLDDAARPDDDHPIARLYGAFLRDRDAGALRAGLAEQLRFLDEHPAIARLIDAHAVP